MNDIDADAGKVTIALPGRSLPNPPEVQWDGTTCNIANYDPSQGYRVIIDDETSYSISDSTFTLSQSGESSRVVSLVAINKWGESFRSHPQYIIPNPLNINSSNAIITATDSSTTVIMFDVYEAGDYLMWLNYSIGDKAAARTIVVNTHLQGMVVLPRKKNANGVPSSDPNEVLSGNVIKISLLKGKNTIILTKPENGFILPHYNTNFDFNSITLAKK